MRGPTTPVAVAFVIATATLTPSAAADTPEGGPGEVTVTPEALRAPLDFSSVARGYYWDFDDETRFGEEQSRSGWTEPGLKNGWFIATSSASNPTIRLNNLHGDATNPAPQEYADTPFDPAYRHLTVRMCSSADTQAMVFFHRNASFYDLDYGGTSFSTISRGCHIYRWDLVTDSNRAIGVLDWDDGGFTGLRLRPVTAAGIEVKIDYATLSRRRKGEAITIGWDAADDPVTLFLSDEANGSRRTRIAGNRTGGEFTWRTPNLPPGTYHIVAASARGRAIVGPSFTVDAPPSGEFISPTWTSGPDYATEVLGNPWDFSSAADFGTTRNLSQEGVAGGLFRGANVAGNSDPGVFLTIDPDHPIDPNRYFYLSYRMRVVGIDSPSQGAVVRWAYFVAPATSDVTEDVREYAGWQTMPLDMRTTTLEPNEKNEAGGWGAAPITKLRIDPHEWQPVTQFQIDWVRLTGPEVADKNFAIRYRAADDSGDPKVRFFYDTDTTTEGRTRITCRPTDVPPDGERVCKWLTKNVPVGEYFIHMLLIDDAGNRRVEFSDIPVVVTH